MVSGWDKSPGPDNDYTPRSPSWRTWAFLATLVLTTTCIYICITYRESNF